jgi:hypothetical protein
MHTDQKITNCINSETINKMKSVTGLFTVPLDRFNISDVTPIQIKSLANGTIYGDMTAIVETDTTSKTCYSPDVSRDMFIQSQP